MRFAGIQPFTAQDFPGRLACILFTQGCDLACPYCHNPRTRARGERPGTLDERDVHDFLDRRGGKLSGVVVSGGEPCIQGDLGEFLRELKERGLAVKLDTNGTHPAVLANLLRRGLVDHLAMDLKDLPREYAAWLGPVPVMRLEASISLVRESGLPHEFRTTVTAPRLDLARLREMARLVGKSPWILQMARPVHGVPAIWSSVPAPSLEAWAKELRAEGIDVTVRGEEERPC